MFSKKTPITEPKSSLLTEKQEFSGFDFSIENLALAGGGSKSPAYVGVIRVFEELGIMKNIKRFGGTSVIATYLALGYDSYEIQKLFDPDFKPLVYGALFTISPYSDEQSLCGYLVPQCPVKSYGSLGWLGQLMNLVYNLGAHSANKLENWIADNVLNKTGDKNFTFMQFSNNEQDTMKKDLDDRVAKYGGNPISTPRTKLSRKRAKKDEAVQTSKNEIKEALLRMMAILNVADTDNSGTISKDEFRTSLQQNRGAFTADDIRILFGCENNPDAIFDIINSDGNGEIEYVELIQLGARRGVDLLQTLCGYERREISGIVDFMGSLADTLLLNVQRVTTTTKSGKTLHHGQAAVPIPADTRKTKNRQ